MKLRKRRIALAVLAALTIGSYAQTDHKGGESVFAPFPSKLRAAVTDKIVVLTWTDSPDVKGAYSVYRAQAPIDAASLEAATRLGEVARGGQSYTDSLPDMKVYYYAVLALAEDGTPYQVFIPARNITATGISATVPIAAAKSTTASPPIAPATPPEAAKPVQPQAPALPFVSALTAKVSGDAILVSYQASPKSRLVLYRGNSPIAQTGDLLDATLVAAFTDKDGSFADYPVPGVDYYYAILGEEDLKAGKIALTLGDNSLKSSVQVRAAALSSGFVETPPASRTPPLPYFLLENEAAGGASAPLDDSIPPARAVSPETAKAIEAILAKAPASKPILPKAILLAEERAAPAGGEDYALSLIVSSKMAAKDWAGAADQLRKYLSLNRGAGAQARAHFYLGEALAFSGSSRDAFFEFLSARDFYPTETKPWIEYVLAGLRDGQ
jgi:hypothetical protein